MQQSLNPSKIEYSKPIHSNDKIPVDIGLITLGVIIVLFVYIIIRVKIILNKDSYYKLMKNKDQKGKNK